MLIIGRAVAGIGGSGIVNGALTILAAIAPKDKRPCTIPWFSACLEADRDSPSLGRYSHVNGPIWNSQWPTSRRSYYSTCFLEMV